MLDYNKFNIDTSSHDGLLKSEALKGFLHNYKVLDEADDRVSFPEKDFNLQGVPSPRQYIAWRYLINMIGEENFYRLPLELVKLSNLEILLVDKFSNLFQPDRIESSIQGEVTFACGYFWRTLAERRNKMKDFIINNILANGWKVNIFTQDENLKREMREKIGKCRNLMVKQVGYRIDVHYIIVDNKVHPEKSYIFLEFPHSEAFYFRLDTYFPLEKTKDFSNCDQDGFLRFLNDTRKLDLWRKSIPSMRGYAINLK